MEQKSRILEISLEDLESLWFEYDNQNDILYINFGKDVEEADESILTESNIVIRIKGNRVVSLMVFDFMRRIGVGIP